MRPFPDEVVARHVATGCWTRDDWSELARRHAAEQGDRVAIVDAPATCLEESSSMRTPVAPTGWPSPMRPPLGLIGLGGSATTAVSFVVGAE